MSIITGTIRHPKSKLPWSDLSLPFRLVTPFAQVDGSYPPDISVVVTAGDGTFTIELAGPARYEVGLPQPSGGRLAVPIDVPEGDTTLEALLIASLTNADPNTLAALIEASYSTQAFMDAVLAVTGGGSGSSNPYGVAKRVITSGNTLTIADDESLVVAGRFTVDGTLTINGGFAVVDATAP